MGMKPRATQVKRSRTYRKQNCKSQDPPGVLPTLNAAALRLMINSNPPRSRAPRPKQRPCLGLCLGNLCPRNFVKMRQEVAKFARLKQQCAGTFIATKEAEAGMAEMSRVYDETGREHD
jgi:hypothetical protein